MNFRGPEAHPNRVEKAPTYATENRFLTFRAGRARPLHRIVVGARHASPGTLESGGSAPSRSVFHGVSRAEGPLQQTTEDDGLPHKAAEPQPNVGRTPRPALPVFEQVDQGVDRGPGGPPHEIVEGCGDLRVV
jgi:hypothetical protein